MFSLKVFFMLQFDEVADKDDLMGVEDTAKRDILFIIPRADGFTCRLLCYDYIFGQNLKSSVNYKLSVE
jgi:hypothetical protein